MINIAIVEDNVEIREGLAVLINGSVGFHCVGTFGNAEAAILPADYMQMKALKTSRRKK
jgi:YesN/AraC family two-component response regulator